MKHTHIVMGTSRNMRVVAALVGLVWLGLDGPARADINWKTGVNGSWEASGSWLENRPPAPTDSLDWIKQSGTYTVSVNDTTADTGSQATWLNNGWVLLGSPGGLATINVNFTNSTAFWKTGNFTVGRDSGSNGQLIMSNGTVNVTGTLALSDASNNTGTVSFVSGKLSATAVTIAQATGNSRGVWTTSGGTNLFATLNIGNGAGGSGLLTLNGGFVAVTNGATTANAYIGINGRGDLNLNTGSFLVDNITLGQGTGTGTVTMAGGNMTIQTQFTLGNVGKGQFDLNGGTLNSVNTYVTLSSTGAGTLNINGGTFTNTGVMYVGYLGTGTMTSSAGTYVGNSISIGRNAGSVGSWTITGGTNEVTTLNIGQINANGGVVISGAGLLQVGSTVSLGSTSGTGLLTNQSGGTVRFTTSTPTITTNNATSKFVVNGAAIEFKDVSAASLTGDLATKVTYLGDNTLRLNNSTNAAGLGATTYATGQNFSTLALVNGNTKWQSSSLTIGNNGQLLVSNSIAHVAAPLTNSGTIRVSNSQVTYDNTASIGGRYISDPSTNTFMSNVVVGVSGTLEGGTGDLFDFKQNLTINSTNKSQYSLSLSTVEFSGGGNHTNAVTGGDFGTNNFFAVNNFGYGKLKLGSASDQLYFVGGGSSNGSTSNALYVMDLDLLGSTNNVANLHSSFNIYYMCLKNDPSNAYLNDQTYALSGGGFLMAVIPEPTTVGLVVLGGLLLRRRFRTSQT